jgi:hypothetical protein
MLRLSAPQGTGIAVASLFPGCLWSSISAVARLGTSRSGERPLGEGGQSAAAQTVHHHRQRPRRTSGTHSQMAAVLGRDGSRPVFQAKVMRQFAVAALCHVSSESVRSNVASRCERRICGRRRSCSTLGEVEGSGRQTAATTFKLTYHPSGHPMDDISACDISSQGGRE